MAGKGGNRQQRQAAKTARRKHAVAAKQQVERLASSLTGRIAAAAASPVERCLRPAGLEDSGIGTVILARRLPSGVLACGFFLVDLLCLGVKDAFLREVAPSVFDERVAEMRADGQKMIPIDPASAKKLILGAVAFAADSGMSPAKDYRTVFKIFDGIDAEAASESFTFGRDGKAIYIPGPTDSTAKLREIERTLKRTRGEHGWDVDLLSSFSQRDRIALHGIIDMMDRRRAAGNDEEDGPIIEHEGSTEVVEATQDA